jgi:predicted nucleic acid-binding protein
LTEDITPLLLDTTAYSFVQRGQVDWVQATQGYELVLSFVTVAEVLYGRLKAGWGDKKLAEEEGRLQRFRVIPGTAEVARVFAQLDREYRDSIGVQDLWIAACALAVPIPLASNDGAFRRIAKRFPLTVVAP